MRGVAVTLVLAGGLVLAAASAADWTTEEVVRDVGGVPLTEHETTAGTELSPGGLREGLLAVGSGLVLLLLRGVPGRILGALVAVLGLYAFLGVAGGWRAAAQQDGDLTPAVALAAVGAVAVAVGGLAAAARQAATTGLSSRYSIDEEDTDAEWDAAAGEEPPTMTP